MELIRTEVQPGGMLTCDEQWEDDRYTLRLTNSSEAPVELTGVRALFAFCFSDSDACFLNGYQSWTYCPERTCGQTDAAMRHVLDALDRFFALSAYSDACFTPPLSKQALRRRCKRGYTYAYVRRENRYTLFASLAEDTGFTRIVFDPAANTILFEKDCAGRVLAPGETYLGLDLLCAEGSEHAVFDAWFEAMGVHALPARPKVGYTSWYNCYQNITEAQILRDLAGVEKLPVKPDVFQIDDGFEPYVGDWLEENPEKFPKGLEPIIRHILDGGCQAGIWLAPFVAEKNSALYREHPDWFQYRGTERVRAGANWSGAYALDPCCPGLRDYLRQSVARYRAMGVTLFKLDFLYAACITPRPDKTRGELMAEAVDFLREICGDCEILACGVPLASAFGRVEYCRIGPDMSLSFDDKPFMRLLHNERPSTLHTQRNTFYRRQLDGRAFRSDPDVFLLREDNTTLTDEQKHTLAVVNALFGSVLFASDDFSAYDAKKHSLFAALCALQGAQVLEIQCGPLQGRLRSVTVTYAQNGRKRTLALQI